jgi:hypothetical protein
MKKKQLYILLIGLSLAGYAWLGWNVAESSATLNACIFKAATHLPCPSCGTTRALTLLMSGDVRGSLFINPFGALLALALVIIPLWVVIDVLRRSDSLFRWYVLVERSLVKRKWISVPAIALVVLNWFWNIAKGL